MLVVLLPLCIWRQKLENSMKFLRTWKPTPHPVPLYGFTLVFSSSVSLIAFTILLVRHLQKTRIRSSHRRCSKTKAILKKFAIFKRKYLRYSLFFNKGAGLQLYFKKTPTQMLYCDYFKIFKSTYFGKHRRTACSGEWDFPALYLKLPSFSFMTANFFKTKLRKLLRFCLGTFIIFIL